MGTAIFWSGRTELLIFNCSSELLKGINWGEDFFAAQREKLILKENNLNIDYWTSVATAEAYAIYFKGTERRR